MNKVVIFIFIKCMSHISYGQFPGSADSLYTFLKFNSIHRTEVDWKEADHTFYEQLKKAKSLNDTMSCFVTVLEKLSDVHTQIFLNNQYFGHYPVFEDTVLVWLKPLHERAISETNQIYSEILADEIGYIRVPTIQPYDQKQINDLAGFLSQTINELSVKVKKGFIIDLRLNGGGNIYPMLSGLSQLLGNQIIAYETDAQDKVARTWEIINGNFVIGGYKTTTLQVPEQSHLKSIPTAIIIGPVTKSAGSMVAIAFKGRPDTVFIGEPTADGYTTSNGYFQFAPNLTLNFATHFVADRNRIVYKTNIKPDITIRGGDDFDNLLNDKKIGFAINWLKKK